MAVNKHSHRQANAPARPPEPSLAQYIQAALRTVSSGSIELVVHEGKVVQIECRQKVYASPEDHTLGH